jgi:hypothetical protein
MARSRLRTVVHVDLAPALPATSAFPEPWIVRARLTRLRADLYTVSWANRVDDLIERLVNVDALVDEQLARTLDELETAVDEIALLESLVASEDVVRELRLTAYDLRRRITVWRTACQLAQTRNGQTDQSLSAEADSATLRATSVKMRAEVDVSALLEAIEQFEYTRLVSHGRNVSDAINKLRTSGFAAEVELAEQIERHYRNANVRIAVTETLLNRMLPQQAPLESKVDDYILGNPVWGRSKTFTQLKVLLLPDENRIRLGVEAWGKIQSNTTASGGPVKVRNRGRSAFVVRKLIVIDHEGMRTKQSHSEAESATNLVGIESNYDNVPILGEFVRRAAERRHTEQRGMALRETERKIAKESRQRFDSELQPKIDQAVSSFEEKIWSPLVQLGLDPKPISLLTTEQRVVARIRLADADHLSAYTARPQALGDSLLSMQVHESVLNNTLDQLDLAGETMTLPEVHQLICKQFAADVEKSAEEMPKNVHITFADYDPIRVRLQDGALKLTLSIAKLEKGSKIRWHNLVVHADYKSTRDGLKLSLARRESIRLEGDRLRFGDQIALRGVFSKLLSQNNRMDILPPSFSADQRLTGLVVTQSVIRDGWIGISIGPMRDQAAQLPVATKRR